MRKSMANISSIITENKCPRCLQELTGDYKKSLKENLEKEQVEQQKNLVELQKKLEELKNLHKSANCAYQNLQQLTPRIDDLKKQVKENKESLNNFSVENKKAQDEKNKLQRQLTETREEIAKFNVPELEKAKKLRDDTFGKYSKTKYELESLMRRKKDLAFRVDELKERLDNAQNKIERKEKICKLLEIIDRIRVSYRNIQPKLRKEFVKYLQSTVQQVLDSLTGDAGPSLTVRIDDSYSPTICGEEGYDREVTNLSGGERTLSAFAYRIGLGQLIMQYRTGHGLYMLLLDEPTESLGREDGSVERLAEAISRLKAIEQIIAVTHNESFAEKAEHVIQIEKKKGASKIFIEK
jgi:DNA sulfur modification protein DndD